MTRAEVIAHVTGVITTTLLAVRHADWDAVTTIVLIQLLVLGCRFMVPSWFGRRDPSQIRSR